ncbi:PREDICTED: perilipin-3 isoform X2 [Chinchilla lanigera]|uniref:perilipin-3 isoform X2 n=1 Tax=Chinchilla lanigera TaxID=34839 RepID=UPI000695DF27|nr:PREDICTED: perilipin-3 isoform X2 [Chinchilla lanigera]
MAAQGTEAHEDITVAPEEPVQQPRVVDRVTNLPLISSTCDMVSAAYASTKDSHPHVRTVCDAAEKGVRTLTAAAVSGAQPILSRLEPQLASASEYAHRGLDKLEENLPILQQPTEKVLADTKELVSAKVSEARDAVSHTVSSAKDSVATRVAGAVDVTRGAVQSGVDMTKSAVTSGVQSVIESRVGQMVLSGAETVLGKSEAWADNHLPMTNAELDGNRQGGSGPEAAGGAGEAAPDVAELEPESISGHRGPSRARGGVAGTGHVPRGGAAAAEHVRVPGRQHPGAARAREGPGPAGAPPRRGPAGHLRRRPLLPGPARQRPRAEPPARGPGARGPGAHGGVGGPERAGHMAGGALRPGHHRESPRRGEVGGGRGRVSPPPPGSMAAHSRQQLTANPSLPSTFPLRWRHWGLSPGPWH